MAPKFWLSLSLVAILAALPVSCDSPTAPTTDPAPPPPPPERTFSFEPVPRSQMREGDTSHFRVNLREGGRRSRVTTGVTSSAPSVLRLTREGDRWRYTAVRAGSAEVRVVFGGRRVLTHSVQVLPPPADFVIEEVYSYATGFHFDLFVFDWRALAPATSIRVRVGFQVRGSWFSCVLRFGSRIQVGEVGTEDVNPVRCRGDLIGGNWTAVSIEPADGKKCRGCGTFSHGSLREW